VREYHLGFYVRVVVVLSVDVTKNLESQVARCNAPGHIAETKKTNTSNTPVVQVVQLESLPERLSDCRTVPYLRFFLVRNEEAEGSNPFSSTRF
jgi:hypothetical protein